MIGIAMRIPHFRAVLPTPLATRSVVSGVENGVVAVAGSSALR